MSQAADISVVIPAHNAAWCIAKALGSVLDQTLPPREIIVIDDGSNDDTSEVLARYGERIHAIHQSNGGLSNARNRGIEAARGDWVALLDADDYWLPTKLERQMCLAGRNPDVGFCSTSARVETPDGELLGYWDCPQTADPTLQVIFEHNAAVAGSGSAVVVRRDQLMTAGLFDESLRSLEDIDMWMRLAAICEYGCVEDPLTVITKRPDSMSGNLDVMRQSALTVMRKNRHLLPGELQGRFWHGAYASVLADYAKWEYRKEMKLSAILHLMEGLLHAPLRRGRLLVSLSAAMLLGKRL